MEQRTALEAPDRALHETVTGADLAAIGQAAALFEDVCVHLPDRMSQGVDPVARLHALQAQPPRDRQALFTALLAIFAEFGDRHTRCLLPAPWPDRFAFLPFTVGRCLDAGTLQIVVTGSADPAIRRGDIVCEWQDRPVAEALRRHMAAQLGANGPARLAKAVQSLTIRSLALLPPPKGTVRIGLRAPDGTERRVSLPWQVGDGASLEARLSGCRPCDDGSMPAAFGMTRREIRKGRRRMTVLRIPSLRIPPGSFIPAVADLLGDLPGDGLILDLRGCEEGFVPTGSALLQLFSTAPVEPTPFQFRLTKWTRSLIGSSEALAGWRDAFDRADMAGQPYSACRPLTDPDAVAGKRAYDGPVIAVVDALTYSTAEMFAAGLQDHGLGRVLGTADRTGGGGASPWHQDLICRLGGDTRFARDPLGLAFQIAVMRCQRTGANAGQLIEGQGVTPDALHQPTRRDLLDGDPDLFARASRMLAERI